jgi:hypothetical protein
MSKGNRPQRPILPLLLIAIGVVLVGAVAFSLLSSGGSGTASPTPSLDANIPYPEIDRVSLADAKAAFDTGQAVFVDVRGEPFYSDAHIPGALSLTEDQLPDELDPSDWIITYCT